MQLRIHDVKAMVEALKAEVEVLKTQQVETEHKFTKLVEELKSVLEQSKITLENIPSSPVETGSGVLLDKITALQNDLEGHVRVYNNHIMQQHRHK